MAGIDGPFTELPTFAVLERFRALCEELGCAIFVKHGDDSATLLVSRKDGDKIEAQVLAISPGRTMYSHGPDWRKDNVR